jgi:hypothetical protein
MVPRIRFVDSSGPRRGGQSQKTESGGDALTLQFVLIAPHAGPGFSCEVGRAESSRFVPPHTPCDFVMPYASCSPESDRSFAEQQRPAPNAIHSLIPPPWQHHSALFLPRGFGFSNSAIRCGSSGATIPAPFPSEGFWFWFWFWFWFYDARKRLASKGCFLRHMW